MVKSVLTLTVTALSLGAEPVGFVLESRGAQVQRAGTESYLGLGAGELVSAGDVIRGEAVVAHCGMRESLKVAGETRITAKGITGKIEQRTAAPVCVLPKLSGRTAGEQHLQVAQARALREGEGESRVERSSGSLLERVAKAEQAGTPESTAALYRGIKADYPEASWISARLFVLEEPPARQAKATKPVDITADGEIYAVLVGVSQYRSGDVRPLRFADRDAKRFAEFLGTGRGGAVKPENLTVLTDAGATTASIRAAFAAVAAKATPKDTVLLLMAMHGTVLESQGRSRGAFLVTHDADPEDLAGTSLPMAELQRFLREDLAKAGRVVAFVDACRAGAIGSIPTASQLKLNRALDALTMTEGELLLYAASRPGEVSYEGPQYGGGHGAFSFFLLEALNGAADFDGDQKIDLKELLNFVSQKVAEATNDRQHPRDGGTLPNNVRLADLAKPGIALGTYDATRTAAGVAAGTSTRAFEGYRVRVLPLRQAVDFDEAIAQGRVMPDVPQNAFAALRQLKLSRRLKPVEYLQQENRLRVLLEEQAQDVRLKYLRGEQNPVGREAFDVAAKVTESARLLTPESVLLEARAEFAAGRLAIFDKDYAKAIGHLERAVKLDGEDACAYNALGTAYLEQARYEEARRAFRDAIGRAPMWAYPRHNLALALMEMGEAAGAIEAYAEARRLAPKYAYLAYNQGYLYQRLNRRKEAEAAYREAARIDPAMADAYNALGLLKAESGDRGEAERQYREAIARRPGFREARHNLALLLAENRASVGAAEGMWRELLKENPGYLPARLSLAKMLSALGRDGEAIAEYEQVVRERPDYAGARQALEESRLRAAGRAKR